MLCCGYTLTDFPISIRLTSLALWQSNDCPSASKATLMNMDKYFMWIHYEWLHNHNKAKHNKTVCIFLGIYCSWISADLEVSCHMSSHDGKVTSFIRPIHKGFVYKVGWKSVLLLPSLTISYDEGAIWWFHTLIYLLRLLVSCITWCCVILHHSTGSDDREEDEEQRSTERKTAKI